MRAFIAVEVSDGIIQRLGEVQGELPEGLRPVNPKNLHITLRFLGDITGSKAREGSEAISSIKFSPFHLACRGLGVFPSEKSIRVLWAGIESPGLLELCLKLEPRLTELGFEKERFTPHLTIARAKGKANVTEILAKYGGEFFGECAVNSFSLRKSTLTPDGPIYEDVRSVSVKV